MINFLLMIIAIASIAVLAIPVLIMNTLRKLYLGDSLRHYFKMVSYGFDQVGGSLLYAQEDWMVSSWTYYLWRDKNNRSAYWFMVFINGLFMDKNHCKESFYSEAERLKFKTEWM